MADPATQRIGARQRARSAAALVSNVTGDRAMACANAASDVWEPIVAHLADAVDAALAAVGDAYGSAATVESILPDAGDALKEALAAARAALDEPERRGNTPSGMQVLQAGDAATGAEIVESLPPVRPRTGPTL